MRRKSNPIVSDTEVGDLVNLFFFITFYNT